MIALVPLPFGSMSPRILWAWVLVLSAITLLASLRPFDSRDLHFLSGVSIVAVVWSFIVVEQIAPNPLLFRRLIDPIWGQASQLLTQDVTGVVSVARNQAFFAAGSQIACMLALVCGFLVGRERRAAYAIVKTITISGLLYALYGIIAFVFWPDHLLWLEKFNYRNSLVATFVNPNVAAVYFGACTLLWLLRLANAVDLSLTKPTQGWYALWSAAFLNRPTPRTISYLIASFVVLSAIFMTGSRAGSIISLLAISGTTATLYRRQLGLRGLLLTFPAVAILVILMMFQILGSSVNQRIDSEGLFDSGRWNAYLSTIEIIKDHPWLGTGVGTFRWAFPAHRSSEIAMVGIWEHAHSTPLELAAEMGIPFTGVVVAAWLLVFSILWRGILTRQRDEMLPLAAFWVAILGVLHSQIDFSLQIPGFSVVVFSLVGMGLAQSASSRTTLTT
ncbi:O-antigen ligase family protein [Bradyrhizobium sp. CCGUVB1N3]|uniref:O-antigen ligase family protein n=1 Tax=Bradyrhizobium sp. CCGUVB1N3 TaxID=2949629 RepID=UPI0020B2A8AE|nr:O-antigen ligase family protein [Bradyrhizobium sp. CCGUVB1N3]MCP3472154.1 O-antigen ligase family protein [Bradyrhizobium sp. CCGUVB1N3]